MRTAYPSEYRQQIVELVRAGRRPRTLAQEFEPSEQTTRNWVKQAALASSQRTDGLTTEERAELRQLRRENRQLERERSRSADGDVAAGRVEALRSGCGLGLPGSPLHY